MNKSSTIGSLAQALSKAQAEIKPAAFNAVNPFLKNRYADLGSIIEAARPVMTKYGLSFTQLVGGGNDAVEVETVLMHESGEFISTVMSLPLTEERGKSAAQAAGSVITYLRRYSLAAIIGIYADEDTDGNATPAQAMKVDPRQAQQVKRQPEPEYDEPVQPPSVIELQDTKEIRKAMSLDDARAITNSEGTRYGDIPTDKLAHMLNAMIKKGDPAHAEKIVAARMILAAQKESEK